MAAEQMTRTARLDLVSLARRRARVAKQDAQAAAASMKAKVEEQLAATWDSQDERWRDARESAQAEINALNERIHTRLVAEGLPERFHPRAGLAWSSRGESAEAARRVELRRLAAARIDQRLKSAIADIDRAVVTIEADLLAVTSGEEARAYLLTMPSAAELLPQTVVDQVAAELLSGEAGS
jgi:hypothetical protein